MPINFNRVYDKIYSNGVMNETAIKEKRIEDIDFDILLENSVDCLGEFLLKLDFTRSSLEFFSIILTQYGKQIRNIADIELGGFLFGIYFGEMMLRNSLREKGFNWAFDPKETMPCLSNGTDFLYPIERVTKKICDPHGDLSVYYVKTQMWGNEDVDFSDIRYV